MMKKIKQTYFLLDFDSTFINREGLEELAKIALQHNPQKNYLFEKIESLTNQAMEGEIPFAQSLSERLKLLPANRSHIEKVTRLLKKNISTSIKGNKKFFKTYKSNIYIISGGFREFIVPIVKTFGIAEDHVFANTFIFDAEERIIGFDKKNPLSQNEGKIKLVKSLKLDGDIYVIGDGYTDYQLKKLGLVKEFIAFTENIEREIVTKEADHIAPSFDEFLYVNTLPMSISYPKNRIKVLLLENIENDAVINFEKEGYAVEFSTKSLSEEELIKKIRNVSILGIRSRTVITQNLLQHANHLMAVGTFTIGINHIDLHTTAQKGTAVFNAPYSSARSVAELTIGEMIILMRSIFEKSANLHQGIWNKSTKGNYELKGKTLGIIGYGNIGVQVGLLAEALGMKVLFYDVVEKQKFGNMQKCESLQKLLKTSDIITLHVDGRMSNANLISEKEFRLMKAQAFFLNASRGSVVDINALVKHLKNGHLGGAAIDVFPKEPKSNDERFISELQQFPNVILTPHIGGSTEEAQKNIGHFVSQKIIDYVNTGNTYLSVNIPNLQLPEQGKHHRLLHIHRNTPGVLAQINGILAEKHINILGQYLKTNEEIGYVITDINKKYDAKVLDILKQIPNTIRFRVLY